jgi:nucleotide-binding universal stress UspA family protein
MRQELGQTMLAAGMLDDITGWTALGLVTGLAGSTATTSDSVMSSLGAVVVFVAATVIVVRPIVGRSLDFIQDRMRGEHAVLSFVVVLAFGWGAVSHWLHLEPVLGAFAAGILVGRLPRLPPRVVHTLEAITMGVLAPIFVATAGLMVDIPSILDPRLLTVALVVIVVATVAKVGGAYLGARVFSGQGHWPALAYGAGLNARGALGIVVASIGLSLEILTPEMFSIIVVMSIVTSLMAPIGLKIAVRHIPPSAEEERRLAKAEAINRTFTAGVLRMLIPVRPRTDIVGTQVMQSTIAKRLAETHSTSTTLLAVAQNTPREAALQYLRTLRALFDHPATTTRVVQSDDPAAVIGEEAARGYGLLMVGVPTMPADDGSVFGQMIDDIIRLAPCPSLVVRGDTVGDTWRPERVLVPVDGSAASRRALDLALAICDADASVIAVHVVTPMRIASSSGLAMDVTAEVRRVAVDLDRQVSTRVIEAPNVETGILEAAAEASVDLIVVGTEVRAGTTRLHIGPRVEYVARHSEGPVVIING